MRSYPVAWWETGEPTSVGRVEVDSGHLALDGRSRDGETPSELTVSYDELTSVRVVRSTPDRLGGRPALAVSRAAGRAINLVSLGGLGTLHEIAETLGHEIAARRVRHEPLEVLIVGGGVGGLEALLALTALAPRLLRVTMLTASTSFVYRPLAVAKPFGRGEEHEFDLRAVAGERGAELRVGTLAAVDRERRLALTASGEALRYDVLLLAAGARAVEALPGALGFWSGARADAFSEVLTDLAAGHARRVVFAVPGGVTWPLPLYELALMTASYLEELGISGVELTFVTPEPHALAVFEHAGGDAVAERLAERGIRLVTNTYPLAFDGGLLRVVGGEPIPADRVVSLPRLVGPAIPGLPCDDRGFVPVDPYMHAGGLPDVYAVGDVTAFPVKQGGIAAQQAEVAADGIAARAGAGVSPAPFRPILRGLVLTGDAPLFLRTELGGGRGATATATSEPLWWPAGKIAGRNLTAYLAEQANSTAA